MESLPAVPAVEMPVTAYVPVEQPVHVPVEEPVHHQNGHVTPAVVQAAVAAAPAPIQQAPEPAPVPVQAPAPVASAPAQVVEPQLFQLDASVPVEPELFSLDNVAPQAVAAPQPPVAELPPVEPVSSSFFIEDVEETVEDIVKPAISAPVAQTHSAFTEIPAEENEDILKSEEELYQAPQAVDPPAPVAAKSSIFSIIEDDEEESESSPVTYQDSAGSHWSDKYLSGSVPRTEGNGGMESPSYDPVDETPRRSEVKNSAPQAQPQAVPAVAGKPGSDFKQSTFDLNQEEVARFKGTDKTIVEGEDLDVPTWMRMRQKVKR